MASTSQQAGDQVKLYRFTQLLTLKLAQVVVQSRQGAKVTQEVNAEILKNHPSTQAHWFNLCIPDEPQVLYNTKQVLNGEIVSALNKVLCIEIWLETAEGERMVLEIWTIKMEPEADAAPLSASALYCRMTTVLKSTLSVSRLTPAYKLSRQQHQQTYNIHYRIFGGQPDLESVGEKARCIKVSSLSTSIGKILVEVWCRSELTLCTSSRAPPATPAAAPFPRAPPPSPATPFATAPAPAPANATASELLMLVSNHFPRDSPKKESRPDLSRPLTLGAFASPPPATTTATAPPTTPTTATATATATPTANAAVAATPNKAPVVEAGRGAGGSPAVNVPGRERGRYANLIEFPFAGGSPITELANFYQECLAARDVEWEGGEETQEEEEAGSDDLGQQLREFEQAVPEFDDMVNSMFADTSHDVT